MESDWNIAKAEENNYFVLRRTLEKILCSFFMKSCLERSMWIHFRTKKKCVLKKKKLENYQPKKIKNLVHSFGLSKILFSLHCTQLRKNNSVAILLFRFESLTYRLWISFLLLVFFSFLDAVVYIWIHNRLN